MALSVAHRSLPQFITLTYICLFSAGIEMLQVCIAEPVFEVTPGNQIQVVYCQGFIYIKKGRKGSRKQVVVKEESLVEGSLT